MRTLVLRVPLPLHAEICKEARARKMKPEELVVQTLHAAAGLDVPKTEAAPLEEPVADVQGPPPPQSIGDDRVDDG